MTDVTTEVETPAESAPAAPAEPVAPVPFWQRPNVERYFMPFIVPLVIVVGIVVFILNISRVFLAAHGHIPVVICSIVLLVILIGATVLANASLRTTSIALMTAGFVFVIFVSGWLVLGSSAEKKESSTTLPAAGPVNGTIKIEASPTGGLSFGPSALSVKTGIYLVVFTDGANTQHTLNFQDQSTLWPGLVINAAGDKLQSRIFFGTAGSYVYFCAIPGHEAAGMKGTVTVTGPTMTVAQAEAAGKPSPPL
jgi:plastocyanin